LLAQVYYEYFKIVSSYIFDIFNTPNQNNEAQKIKEIDTILTAQLDKMGNLFIDTLQGYLNK